MFEFFTQYGSLLWQGTLETLFMTFTATLFSYVFGLPLGVLVVITKDHSIWPRRALNRVLGWVVNIGRSIPFIILLVALIPFTRFIMGTALGVKAAVVPLVVAATPFVARMVETSLTEVDSGVIEVAQSTGSTIWQMVTKVIIPESMPSLVLGVSITCITLFGYSAMAGVIGAGGLGDIAIRYGYYRYQTEVMVATVIILVILVQIVQSLGSFISHKIDKRIRK